MTSPEPTRIETLTALLRHFDWAPSARLPGVYEVWTSEDEREELLVPLDPERGDFGALLQRAQQAVLGHYGRAARELMATLQLRAAAALDQTEWRKDTALEAGLIGWEQGESLYAAARMQLVAAAKSTRAPKRYHGHSSSHVARRFLEGTFMGQTSVGSYVITAFTPANDRFYLTKRAEEHAQDQPPGLWENDVVTGREILTTFERALRALRAGLDEYRKAPTVEIFADAVDDGVSYEFTKALSEAVAAGDAEIVITRPAAGVGVETVTRVSFDAVEAPVLNTVATSFAQDEEPRDVTVIGEVTLLSRSSDDPDQLIRINIEQGADVRKARVRLTESQYELAMDAHQREASLKVSGRLEREGNLYWLYDATGVEVIDMEPEDDVGEVGPARDGHQTSFTIDEDQ